MRKYRLVWAGVQVTTYLALAGLVLALWFYAAAEKTVEVDPLTGLAIPDFRISYSPSFFDRLRDWLSWIGIG